MSNVAAVTESTTSTPTPAEKAELVSTEFPSINHFDSPGPMTIRGLILAAFVLWVLAIFVLKSLVLMLIVSFLLMVFLGTGAFMSSQDRQALLKLIREERADHVRQTGALDAELRVRREAIDRLERELKAAESALSAEKEAHGRTEAARREQTDLVESGNRELRQARRQIERLERYSPVDDESFFIGGFVDRRGQPITDKRSTHLLSLALEGRLTGCLPVRFSDEVVGECFYAHRPDMGVEIICSALPGVGYHVEIKDLWRSPKDTLGGSPHYKFPVREDPSGAPFYTSRVSGIFRPGPAQGGTLQVHGDLAIMRHLVITSQRADRYPQDLRRMPNTSGLRGMTIAGQMPVVSNAPAAPVSIIPDARPKG